MAGNNIRNKKTILLIVVSLLAICLLVAVALLIYIAPMALKSIGFFFKYQLDSSSLVIMFVFLFFFSVLLFLTIIAYYFKIHDGQLKLETELNSDIPPYGDYSNERRYLEKQIDELTSRLVNTEEKWTRLNHLILAANDKNFENRNEESSKGFLSGLGIDLESIKIDKKMIFVLTPSDREYFQDFAAVHKACHDYHLNAVRGDDEDLKYGNKNMLTYIIEHILAARVVIANISNRNPNVFYEIGIAHMAGKPTILLCRANEKVPFDLQQKYIVFYSSEEELINKLKDELFSIIAEEN